jgi:hypothetical protein
MNISNSAEVQKLQLSRKKRVKKFWYLSAIEIIDTQVARRGRQYHRNPPSYKKPSYKKEPYLQIKRIKLVPPPTHLSLEGKIIEIGSKVKVARYNELVAKVGKFIFVQYAIITTAVVALALLLDDRIYIYMFIIYLF